MNRELNGGAWCPANQLDIKNSGKEWIQVNFTEPYVITKIATQGRFGNGMGVEFAERFWLRYTRNGIDWIHWRNKYGEYVSGIVIAADAYTMYFDTFLSLSLIIYLTISSAYLTTC